MSEIFMFFVIFLLIYGTRGQIAKCDYSYKYYWTIGYKTTNFSYYKCNLNTEEANYNERLTRIDGQHETGHSDADVKWIGKYKDNKLKTFSSIFCQNFPNLEVIQISVAELESTDEDSLSNCKNLDHLLLIGNKLRELPEYLLIRNSKLTYFRIRNNQLTTLPENFFLNQKNLEDLIMSDNQINFLPNNIFRSLAKLELLFLHNNNLESINPEWFVNLQNLKLLTLSGNQISEIPSKCFASLRNLEQLFLYDNKIKTLNFDSFDGLQNLQILNLHSNEISDLPVGVFNQLKNLQYLDLNNNKLTSIHSDFFDVHNQLKRIYLEDNKINSIDPNLIDNTAISTLNMKNNICSSFYTKTKSEIKPNLTKCIDNYQPREPQVNSCGQLTGAKAIGTIIGGTQVKRGMFPWIAALIKSDGKYFCGGTLFTSRKVVTAAHCMLLLAQDITVLLGSYDLSKQNESGWDPYAVQSIYVHPDWNTSTEAYDADIAVMVLKTQVTFGKYIQPICLMDSNSDLAKMQRGIVVGYGKDENPDSIHLNIPKFINMPIHQNEDCFLKNYELLRLSSKRTFCGGSGDGTGSCLGDSGSGMIVTDGRAYYLRGIVSASLNNKTYGCDVDTYSIFTNVSDFTEWMNGIPIEPNF